MRKAALIVNPASGRSSRKKIDFVLNFLKEKEFEVTCFVTNNQLDAKHFSIECLNKRIETIIIAGGDGTINEAIQPLIFSNCRIAILPLGTANVLSKELGIPNSLKRALNLIIEGKEKKISAGKIVLTLSGETRYFLLMAGIGFDAEVVFSNNEKLKKFFGRFSYIISGFKTLFNFSQEEIIFKVDGEEFSGYSALISNSSRYGGNFKITKAASIFEPDFHSLILERNSSIDIIKIFFSSFLKFHPAFEGLQFKIAKEIKIEGNAKIQCDGEFAGNTPCEIKIVPQALTIIC